MKLLVMVAALLLQAENEADELVKRMTLDQLMRISALPPARVQEMHCAALALWLNQNHPDHRFALPGAEAARLANQVGAAIANDAEMPEELARDFVRVLVIEPDGKIGERTDPKYETAIGELALPCDKLFGEAREGKTLSLHPLAKPSVVSPALATCYALYKAAASRAKGDEAVKLGRDADRAAELALQGKDGAARTAAEAALASEAVAALKAPEGEPGAEMMRLVMCVPHLKGLNSGGEVLKP